MGNPRQLGYLGAKLGSGAFQAVIASMPVHDTYIETHLGSGVVMRRKPASARSIGLEIDADTLAQFGPIPDVEIHNVDCLAFLRTFDFASAGRVLIYADPPYVLATRHRRRYAHDYTDQDHRELIAVLRDVPASVMISGYPSDLYAELLGDWRRREYQVTTLGGPRTEVIWMSFPEGPVHSAAHAGANFTDRQRIKRKAERWKRMYGELSQTERLAVFAALLEVHGSDSGSEI